MPGNSFFSTVPCTNKESRNILLSISLFIAVGLVEVYLSPVENLLLLFGVKTINGCPLLTFAGIPCPFCGMGRVFSCITDLYIARSFFYNPLGLVFYILLGGSLGYITLLAMKKKKLVFTGKGKKLIWIPVGFIALMWILNILYGHHH